MRVFAQLPQDLRVAAYVADGEYAWRADAAHGVVDWLTRNGVAVIGIDVWLPTEPGPTIPTPFVYAWEAASQDKSQPWAQFVRRANASAAEYIARFSWDPRDSTHASATPYFNLTILAADE